MLRMNNNMMDGGQVITHGKFLVWIGLWFVIETIQGFYRPDFWINITIDTFDMAL